MMIRRWLTRVLLLSAATTMVACGSEPADSDETLQINTEDETEEEEPSETAATIPALGDGEDSLDAVEITTIADQSDGLAGPRDVEINPHAPNEMWVVSRDDNSTTILTDFGTDDQSSATHSGFGSAHFAAKVSALAFGEPGSMATAQQEDEITQSTTPHDFMGPTLWPSDSSEFEGGHSSHLDMLHNSPLSSGIAWDEGTAYWVFDGYHGSITHYDFQSDHGQGGADHSDGVVRRYADNQVKVVNGIVAHLAFDKESELLYIADTGNNRVAVLETDTGELGGTISPNYDGVDQKMVNDAVLTTLIDGSDAGMAQPAGLELVDGVLYVGDSGASTIYAFDTDGQKLDSLNLSEQIPAGAMMGMAIDDEGRIYVVNSEDNEILRIAPKTGE